MIMEQLWDERENVKEIEYINLNDNLCYASKELASYEKHLTACLEEPYGWLNEDVLAMIDSIMQRATHLDLLISSPLEMSNLNYPKIHALYKNQFVRYNMMGMMLYVSGGKIYFPSGYLADEVFAEPDAVQCVEQAGKTIIQAKVNGKLYYYNKKHNEYYEHMGSENSPFGILEDVPLHLVGQ